MIFIDVRQSRHQPLQASCLYLLRSELLFPRHPVLFRVTSTSMKTRQVIYAVGAVVSTAQAWGWQGQGWGGQGWGSNQRVFGLGGSLKMPPHNITCKLDLLLAADSSDGGLPELFGLSTSVASMAFQQRTLKIDRSPCRISLRYLPWSSPWQANDHICSLRGSPSDGKLDL